MTFVWVLNIEDVSKVPPKKIRSKAFKSHTGAKRCAEEHFGGAIKWRVSRRIVCSPVLDGILYSIHHYRVQT